MRSFSFPSSSYHRKQIRQCALIRMLYCPARFVDNASPHTKGKFLLKMDFKDFFPSLKAHDFRMFLRRIQSDLDVAEIAALCQGALAASLIVRALFLESQTLGATIPAGRASQSFVLEVLLTSILMFVILGVSTGAKEKGLLAGVAVGGAVALGSLLGGPVSGASMNPARSLGPGML